MNYIHKLEDQSKADSVEITFLYSGIVDLECYLSSDKFNSDPTVQVKDILTRLTWLKSLAQEKRTEQESINFERRNPEIFKEKAPQIKAYFYKVN